MWEGREGEGSPRLEPPSVKSLGEATKESVVQSRSRLWSVHSMVNAHRLCLPDYHPAFCSIIVLNIRRSRVSTSSPLKVSRPEER